MWQCVKCHQQIEESFGICWNCGTSREGVENPNFHKVDDVEPEGFDEDLMETGPGAREIRKDSTVCPLCRCKLRYIGTKSFHEGTRWGVIGDIGELFVNKEQFDVYCCPKCGRVEFFVDGIGEYFRPH